MIDDGRVIDDSECSASIFHPNCQSMCNTEYAPHELHQLTDKIFISITEDFVLNELSKLSAFKSSGIDNLHPRRLKFASPFITRPL